MAAPRRRTRLLAYQWRRADHCGTIRRSGQCGRRGLPTTAACPGFAYDPPDDAPWSRRCVRRVRWSSADQPRPVRHRTRRHPQPMGWYGIRDGLITSPVVPGSGSAWSRWRLASPTSPSAPTPPDRGPRTGRVAGDRRYQTHAEFDDLHAGRGAGLRELRRGDRLRRRHRPGGPGHGSDGRGHAHLRRRGGGYPHPNSRWWRSRLSFPNSTMTGAQRFPTRWSGHGNAGCVKAIDLSSFLSAAKLPGTTTRSWPNAPTRWDFSPPRTDRAGIDATVAESSPPQPFSAVDLLRGRRRLDAPESQRRWRNSTASTRCWCLPPHAIRRSNRCPPTRWA